jgi:hypothetical protein
MPSSTIKVLCFRGIFLIAETQCSDINFGGIEFDLPTGDTAEERAAAGGTMSCQELLALSGALSAALPTGQVALDSFFEELTKGISKRAGEEKSDTKVIFAFVFA